MKKVFKWIGIILAVLILLVLVVAGSLLIKGSSQLSKTYQVQPVAIAIPDDQSSIERGAYIYQVSCAGCHGEDLSGKVILDDPAIGYLPAPNLTAGIGGVGSHYSETDFARAIRHGIDAEGQGLLIMPSKAYWHFSEEDLGAIIAYIKTAPPINNDLGQKSQSPLGKIMLAAGAFGEAFAADVLDHNAPLISAPERDSTAAYGEYLVNTSDCRNCHGPDLAGAQSPEPGSPYSPNLTPAGVLTIWTTDDFIETMHTGVTPYGRQLDPDFMPYEYYSRMNDQDLTAIFLYLQSLPAIETASK